MMSNYFEKFYRSSQFSKNHNNKQYLRFLHLNHNLFINILKTLFKRLNILLIAKKEGGKDE